MTYARHGAEGSLYSPCYYTGVDGAFRGPKRSLDGPYVTFLGGTVMYGKYAKSAIPDLVEQMTGVPCVNLGVMNGGVPAMTASGLQNIANGGLATVIEVVGAHNLSNQFYRVHPRRNDRLVSPTRLFRKVFPEVDLSDIHFTRHLLSLICSKAPSRFDTVIEELRASWVEQMQALLDDLSGPKILLWVVPKPRPAAQPGGLADPLFIDPAAVASLQAKLDAVIELRETPEVTAQGYAGMALPETRSRVVEAVPRAALLQEAALALLDPLQAVGIGPGARGARQDIRKPA